MRRLGLPSSLPRASAPASGAGRVVWLEYAVQLYVLWYSYGAERREPVERLVVVGGEESGRSAGRRHGIGEMSTILFLRIHKYQLGIPCASPTPLELSCAWLSCGALNAVQASSAIPRLLLPLMSLLPPALPRRLSGSLLQEFWTTRCREDALQYLVFVYI